MAAQSGVMNFLGTRTKMTYSKNVYFDDNAGALVRFDVGAGAGATSPTEFIPPETVILTDVCLAAATGQTKTQLVRGGIPTGDILLNAIHLASVTVRPQLRVVIPRGAKLEAIQLA